ncbi:MAG: hypothetical protein ACFE8M_13125 [Candidatus Hermodarchaeota archaeon]
MTNDILDTNSLIMNEVKYKGGKKSKKKRTSKNSPESYLDMSKDISKA